MMRCILILPVLPLPTQAWVPLPAFTLISLRNCHRKPRISTMAFVKGLIAGAVAIAAQTTTAFPAPSMHLKVMTFNLRTSNARDPCPQGCWEVRKWRAKQLVERYQPDLIGTQEGAPTQIEFFTSNMSFSSIGLCSGECSGNERNSIFYKPERWEVLNETTFALSDTPEVIGSNTWNLEYLRTAVMARFRDRTTYRVVCMLNTHYDITRGQNESSVLVAKRLSEFCQADDAVFMTGDLNAIPTTAAVRYLENEIELNGSKTPIPLYDSLTVGGAGTSTWIGNSFGSQTWEPWKFDYIFTRDDADTCLQNAKVLVDLFDGFSSSDHAVPISEFCLGSDCSNCIRPPQTPVQNTQDTQNTQMQVAAQTSV